MDSDNETYMRLFAGLLNQITAAGAAVVLEGGAKLIQDPDVAKSMAAKEIQPYLYLSGFLNLLGREINSENMIGVMKGVGLEPDLELIEITIKGNNENSVIYLYSVYLLSVLGMEYNTKNVMDIVRSLGLEPNVNFAQNALNAYNKRYKK